MSILVTGGAGYIGSHTCVDLLNAGKELIILDNFQNSKPEVLNRIKKLSGKEFKFYQVNLLDKQAIDKVFEENQISSVIHFAGMKAVGESCQIPLRYYHNNITGTLNLLESMGAHGCKKIVFSSSSCVYGKDPHPPCQEPAASGASNPYGSTKFFIEQILTDLQKAEPDWSIVCLRYFNPMGAHKSGILGEDPSGIPSNLLPYISQVATGRLEILSIFGGDYDTPDGTCIRDFIHVLDVARGHINAVDYCLSHTGFEAVNLGCGRGFSVLEVVHAFEKATGAKVNFKIVGRRAGDIGAYYCDNSKAKTLLGWEAIHTLEEMCADAYNFDQKNPKGY